MLETSPIDQAAVRGDWPAEAIRAFEAASPQRRAPGGGRDAVDLTLCGLSPIELHDRFWAAHGVQVVRAGTHGSIVDLAELFLLVEPDVLVLFNPARALDTLTWNSLDIMFIRLHHDDPRYYRELVRADASGLFQRFERDYGGRDRQVSRVALCRNRRLAGVWQVGPTGAEGWRRLRRESGRLGRGTSSTNGGLFQASDRREVARFARRMVDLWRRPDATIAGLEQVEGTSSWRHAAATVTPGAELVGPVWIGAGRVLGTDDSVVGPAVLWDDPEHRPAQKQELAWDQIAPLGPIGQMPARAGTDRPAPRVPGKRLFDIAFALMVLTLTGWIFPLVMLAIWLEDGSPFFFAHRRETQGGREFPCLKFRSMRKDAERMKRELAAKNQADGPQFFIADDPRLTRVGAFIRKYNIDELPQFLNVLAGHMSVVGPRPSPRSENQFCPPWREARLSVRPGVTGLWQVMRTREAGKDFQEWIKYDLEYVANRSWLLDLRIIWWTVRKMLGGW